MRFNRTTLCGQVAQCCTNCFLAETAFSAFFRATARVGGLSAATHQGVNHEVLVVVDSAHLFEAYGVVTEVGFHSEFVRAFRKRGWDGEHQAAEIVDGQCSDVCFNNR